MIILNYGILDAGDQSTSATATFLTGVLDFAPGGPDQSVLDYLGYTFTSIRVRAPAFPGDTWKIQVRISQTPTSQAISPTLDDDAAATQNLYTSRIAAATGARVEAADPVVTPLCPGILRATARPGAACGPQSSSAPGTAASAAASARGTPIRAAPTTTLRTP